MNQPIQFLKRFDATPTDRLTFAYDYTLGTFVCFFEYTPDDGRSSVLFIGVGDDMMDAHMDALKTCAATNYHHLIRDSE